VAYGWHLLAPSLLGLWTAAPGVMVWGDTTRIGRPFSKDPCVVRVGERYLMYYSLPPSNAPAAPPGWAIGIAESTDLTTWSPVGTILPRQECEQKGLVNGKVIRLDGVLHLFYNTYGNGRGDALCHATSTDGLIWERDPGNPILSATGDWNCGRAIDLDVVVFRGKLMLYFATRDPQMDKQLLVAASAELDSGFGRGAWTQLGDGPVMRPELPWETRCIEAPSAVVRDERLYLFYGGGYNNDPQQIGCAVSADGVHFERLFVHEPLLPHGGPGDWNASESGHPGLFEEDGRTFMFFQGNPDRGRSWYLSMVELGWRDGLPYLLTQPPRGPADRQ